MEPMGTLRNLLVGLARLAGKEGPGVERAADRHARRLEGEPSSAPDGEVVAAVAVAIPSASITELRVPSAALAAVIGPEPITRFEAVDRLWKYMKGKGLIGGGRIQLDHALKTLCGERDSITPGELGAAIDRHLTAPTTRPSHRA